MSEQKSPTWEEVAAAIDRAQRSIDSVSMPCVATQLAICELQTAEQLVGDIRDAALARLAEPSAAERWRAVPALSRAWALRIVTSAQKAHADMMDLADHQGRADALDALLALASEAERRT